MIHSGLVGAAASSANGVRYWRASVYACKVGETCILISESQDLCMGATGNNDAFVSVGNRHRLGIPTFLPVRLEFFILHVLFCKCTYNSGLCTYEFRPTHSDEVSETCNVDRLCASSVGPPDVYGGGGYIYIYTDTTV